MTSPQCLTCKHFEADFSCSAFPDGIPPEILTGEIDHRDAHPGDNGIRWEPVSPAAAEMMDELDQD